MTLATTCPHCKTSFRVVADQLKLRRGLVRCGRCHQVFSGVDALTYLDEPSPAVAPQTGNPPALRSSDGDLKPTSASDPAAEAVAAQVVPEVVPEVVPHVSTRLPDTAQLEHELPASGAGAMEPAVAAQRSVRQRRPIVTLLFVAGIAGLVVQALIGWRHELAYRWPIIHPTVARVCEQFELELHPPLDARALTIESFEVSAAGEPMKLSLDAVIRNRSGRTVAFPAIELTLRDSQSVLLSRSVIEAQAYVSAEQRPKGLTAGAEWTIHVPLEHDGLAVTGYSAVLFHP